MGIKPFLLLLLLEGGHYRKVDIFGSFWKMLWLL